jgi:hypothetical protein
MCADGIVAERNNGGAMVKARIRIVGEAGEYINFFQCVNCLTHAEPFNGSNRDFR